MTLALPYSAVRGAAPDKAVGYWLLAVAGLTVSMVVIGGITRLTESGLSITQWQPISGIIPPLDDAQWQAEFARYREIPQYRELHSDMSLGQFKIIFFWEYLHRLVGRLTGLVALAGPLALLVSGRARGTSWAVLFAVPVLVLLQGVLGWYMVMSGLSARTSVSQYRLTAHLATALILYVFCLWQAASVLRPAPAHLGERLRRRWADGLRLVLGLAAVTILAGGFTAGTHAGLVYNTFPLMDGRLVPAGYWQLDPWWSNPFENVTAIQFDHRVAAMMTFSGVLLLWCLGRWHAVPDALAGGLSAMAAAACLQVALGIATLVWVVPVPLAAAHQAGAVLLLTTIVLTLHRVARRG